MKPVPKTALAKMETHVYDFPLRVLLYKEDGEFVAHALEMDLLGHGETHKSAISALKDMILCQITFAHQKKDAGLLSFPAPKEFFDRWEKARAAALKSEVIEDKSLSVKYVAACVSIPRARVQGAISRQRRYAPMAMEACA